MPSHLRHWFALPFTSRSGLRSNCLPFVGLTMSNPLATGFPDFRLLAWPNYLLFSHIQARGFPSPIPFPVLPFVPRSHFPAFFIHQGSGPHSNFKAQGPFFHFHCLVQAGQHPYSPFRVQALGGRQATPQAGQFGIQIGFTRTLGFWHPFQTNRVPSNLGLVGARWDSGSVGHGAIGVSLGGIFPPPFSFVSRGGVPGSGYPFCFGGPRGCGPSGCGVNPGFSGPWAAKTGGWPYTLGVAPRVGRFSPFLTGGAQIFGVAPGGGYPSFPPGGSLGPTFFLTHPPFFPVGSSSPKRGVPSHLLFAPQRVGELFRPTTPLGGPLF